jgi:alpha-amylase
MSNDLNGVLLQAFHWFSFPDQTAGTPQPLWRFLAARADELRGLGFDAVWLPPASKAMGRREDVGYGVHDHFDLGEFEHPVFGKQTKYGTRQELHDAINALHGFREQNGQLVRDGERRYLQVYADAVLNHKAGGERDGFWQAVRVETSNRNVERWEPGFESGPVEIESYTGFDHAVRGGQHSRFQWRARHFDSVDTAAAIRQNEAGPTFADPQDRYIYRFIYNEQNYQPQVKPGFEDFVSREKGNFDYLTGADLDYGRHDVREEMKYWGEWMVRTTGVDGFRLDAVKHIDGNYVREWVGHVRARADKPLFCVGEHLSSNVDDLHAFINHISAHGPFPQQIHLLDFPLRFRFRDASWLGDGYDIRGWNRRTLMAEQPALAVTFVETHDYEYGRNVDSHVQEWLKPIAYAYILLRAQGYPMVFFPDLYGSAARDTHQGQPAGRGYLQLLLKLRKQFALGAERYYEASPQAVGWVRMGGVPGARGAMAVVINTGSAGVRAVRMDTGRANRRFYHLATIKPTGVRGEGGAVVVPNRYDLYGDKAEAIFTDGAGAADFLADSGAVAIWLEDGVGPS